MAIRDLTKAAGILTSKDRLPRERYAVRCLEETFGPSKGSGNPMITREWEIVAPESVLVNGVPKIVAGLTVKQYLPTIVLDADGKRDDDKSDKALARIRDEDAALEIARPDGFDDENPSLLCKDIVADAILSSEESVARKDLTPEQLAKGIRMGDPIKDDDGKEIKTYRIRLDNILGLSSVKVNSQF